MKPLHFRVIFRYLSVISLIERPTDVITHSEVLGCICNHEVGARTAQGRPR